MIMNYVSSLFLIISVYVFTNIVIKFKKSYNIYLREKNDFVKLTDYYIVTIKYLIIILLSIIVFLFSSTLYIKPNIIYDFTFTQWLALSNIVLLVLTTIFYLYHQKHLRLYESEGFRRYMTKTGIAIDSLIRKSFTFSNYYLCFNLLFIVITTYYNKGV